MRYLLLYMLLGFLTLPVLAQDNDEEQKEQAEEVAEGNEEQQTEEHVYLLGVPLNATPEQLLDAMQHHGIRYDRMEVHRHTHLLKGRLSGMEVTIEVRCNKDDTKINLVKFHTAKYRNQREDYERMRRWLQKEYDAPDWDGTVRNHHFCRWFVDFDRDILLMAAGDGTVEVWFYENHQQRNIDYYSILKYCERNPAADIPFLTAQESVTWKSDTMPVVRKHVAKRHGKRSSLKKRKNGRRKTLHRKTTKKRKTTKSKKRRR